MQVGHCGVTVVVDPADVEPLENLLTDRDPPFIKICTSVDLCIRFRVFTVL